MRYLAEEHWTQTTCPYCGVGCGVLVKPSADGEKADVKGDPDHPANFGRLCSKGAALGETLSLNDRLLTPLVKNIPATWDEALDLVADRFTKTIAEHGPDSVALYVSGQILTEDYYVANKLMKGYIGSANIDTNSRLCMASSVAGHKRAFGSDTVPGNYEDLELADLVVLVGSNLAWCHPVLYQRLVAAREDHGTRIVVIDPRETATCEIADLHLALKPGSDVALFNGLLLALHQAGALNEKFVRDHTSGFDETFATALQLTLDDVARITGLTAHDINTFYGWLAETDKTVTVYSQGVNQSSAGTDKVNAILNCHLATGRIGRPGSGPFSVTGQPNAMGGREVGGLATMLAAHLELGNPEHSRIVREFWKSPKIADQQGLKAIDLFQAVGDGRIKAVWIMATNPVDSMPEANAVRDALSACPFVVVSDVMRHTDTTAVADVLLPAAAWGEKDGTVTNSERRISRQRSFLDLPVDVKPDWWQVCELAKRMGYGAAFDYSGPAEIFAEYAALTGAKNDGSRDLDISVHSAIDAVGYDALDPFQWPQSANEEPSETRFFANGGFYTPNRRANFVPTPYRPPASDASREFPLVLNTGRIRDQWHTMTRTAKAPRLTSHYAEPFIEIHPDDAAEIGLIAADLTEIESPQGRIVVRAAVTERVAPGTVFAPMHWTDQYASSARVGTLIANNVDPLSGQPESKIMPVRVRPFRAEWYAFAVVQNRPRPSNFSYAAIALTPANFWRTELAGTSSLPSAHDFAVELLGAANGSDEPAMVAYHDIKSGQHRFAAFIGQRCVGLLYLAPAPVQVSRTWAIGQVGRPIDPGVRLAVLAGRPGVGLPDKGQIVCSCLEVGRNQIVSAISDGGCQTIAAIGLETRAGTNCGSCRAEIGRLIHDIEIRNADKHGAALAQAI